MKTRLNVAGGHSSKLPKPPTRHCHVTLVYPHLPEAAYKTQLVDRESLALGFLSASLKKHGFPVRTINAERLMLAPEDVAAEVLKDPELRLLGISTGSQRTYRAAKIIAGLVKRARPEVVICAGGIFPTAADEQVVRDCQDIDCVVRGEGEYAIVELATFVSDERSWHEMDSITWCKDGELHRNPGRERLSDIDEIGFASRDDIEAELAAGRPVRSAKMIASRGCYARCTFCSIHQIYGDHLVMRRRPEKVVEEMISIADRFGVKQFAFHDDVFITPSRRGLEWAEKFCDLLIERNYGLRFWFETRADTISVPLMTKFVKAGMFGLFLGIEAGVDSILKRWDKGITAEQNRIGLDLLKQVVGLKPDDVRIGYIMFDREMTFDELGQNYRWLRDSGHAMVHNLQNKMNIYWGTPAYKQMESSGLIDTAPLGDRWPYEIDDPRVNQFEKALRRFLERTHASYFDELVPAKKSYIAIRYGNHENLTPWVREVMSQALRALEQLERATWYYMFDNYLEKLAVDFSLDSGFEEAVWQALDPIHDEILTQSRDFKMLTASGTSLQVLDQEPTSAPTETAIAWRSSDGVWGHIWLPNVRTGYRARLGTPVRDYYDHGLSWVVYEIVDSGLVMRPATSITMHEHALTMPLLVSPAAQALPNQAGSFA